MKICAIDIGTNSVICLHARVNKKNHLSVFSFRAKTTRLGESLYNTGVLKETAQIRTLNAINNFIKICPSDKYILAGTSALREAKNSKSFLTKVPNQTGYKVNVISGKREAQMVFDSVKYFLRPSEKYFLICDIGGGSTEFIFCKNGKISKIASVPLGAVRIKEIFGKDYRSAERFVENILQKQAAHTKASSFICVGGTATTLTAIAKGLRKYNTKKINKTSLSLQKIEKIFLKLSSSKLSDIKRLIPFDPKRADIITAGVLILKTIMKLMEIKKVRICDRGLVYGLVLNCRDAL